MLYREIIAVCSGDPHKTHKYTVWTESRSSECYTGGTQSYHWDLVGGYAGHLQAQTQFAGLK